MGTDTDLRQNDERRLYTHDTTHYPASSHVGECASAYELRSARYLLLR